MRPPALAASRWIGLLSGTSADAVDAALVEISPSGEMELIAALEVPLCDALRARIHAVCDGGAALRELVALDVELGHRLADAAVCVCESAGGELAGVEGIASHGQTVGHFPEPAVRGSLQLGSAAVLHARTGRPIVSDFRALDLAHGGQGAPLTPLLHLECLSACDERRAVLNLGGFTNVTYLPDRCADRVVAFDPGPGNALIDRAARWVSGGRERCDRDGLRASRGRVLKGVLEDLLSHPYFAAPAPKSTGHEQFGAAFFERARSAVERAGGSPEDLFATLAELTVESVRAGARLFGGDVDRWLVYGGGVRNADLMGRLERALAPAPVDTTCVHGFPAESVEAMAFALLGWRAARGWACNLPAVTGARAAGPLGVLTPPGAFGPPG